MTVDNPIGHFLLHPAASDSFKVVLVMIEELVKQQHTLLDQLCIAVRELQIDKDGILFEISHEKYGIQCWRHLLL